MCTAEHWIKDVQGLDALPDDAIVVDTTSNFAPRAYQKGGDRWEATGIEERIPAGELPLPLKLFHVAEQWIENVQGLDALPDHTLVLSSPSEDLDLEPRPYQKILGRWNLPGNEEDVPAKAVPLPAKILYLP